MIQEVEKEISAYQPINSEGQRSLQGYMKNIKESKEFISIKVNDLENQYHMVAARINRQYIGILRDKT